MILPSRLIKLLSLLITFHPVLTNLNASPTGALTLTGFATLNEKDAFVCLFDPLTQERFGVSPQPDTQGNKLLTLHHQNGQGLYGSSGTALIRNQIRSFGHTPEESGSSEAPPSFTATRIIELSHQDSFKSQGYELGHRAALQTIPLIQNWTTNPHKHPRTRTFLIENPLPPDPTQEDLLLAWQDLLAQVGPNCSWWGKAPKLHLVVPYSNASGRGKLPYSSPPDENRPIPPLPEEEFYKGYVYGWNDTISSFLAGRIPQTYK